MSRPYMLPKEIFNAASMTSTIHSIPACIDNLSLVGFDISWAGAPVGTFSIEVSNSYNPGTPLSGIAAPGSWTALTLSTPITATGTPGNAFIDIDAISATYIRLTYTATSGTGSLTAYLSAKVS